MLVDFILWICVDIDKYCVDDEFSSGMLSFLYSMCVYMYKLEEG